jgi:hypothetical protein
MAINCSICLKSIAIPPNVINLTINAEISLNVFIMGAGVASVKEKKPNSTPLPIRILHENMPGWNIVKWHVFILFLNWTNI